MAGPAVRVALRAEVRRRRVPLLALTLAIACTVATLIVLFGGARRTMSVFDRYREATNGAHAVLFMTEGGFDIADELRAVPGVAGVGGFQFTPVVPNRPGIEPFTDVGGFAAIDDSFGREIYKVRILEGRAADPDRPEEVTFNEELLELSGLSIGDRFTVKTFGEPIDQELVLVGVHLSEFDLTGNAGHPFALYTHAFFERWQPQFLEEFGDGLQPSYGVRLTSADREPEFVEYVQKRFGTAAVVIGAEAQTAQVIDGLRVQATALAILGAIAGLAALVVLGQAISRELIGASNDMSTMRAIGLPRRDRATILLAPRLIAIAVGVVVGALVSVPASALMPIDFARRIEPDRGVRVDAPAVLAVAVGAFAVLVAVTAVAAWRRSTAADATAPAGEALRLPHIASVPVLVGLRNALIARGDARSYMRSAIAAVVVAVTGLVGVATFLSSRDHLFATPRLHGWSFNYIVSTTDEALAGQLATVGASDDAIAYGSMHETRVIVDGKDADAFVIESARGSVFPTLVHGRSPASSDEVVIGSVTAERLGRKVGDRVEVAGDGPGKTMRIVGVAAVPGLADGDFGDAVVLTAQAAEAVGLDQADPAVLVRLRAGVEPADIGLAPPDSLGGEEGVRTPFLPPAVLNLERSGSLPVILGAFLALLGAAAIAHALLAAARHLRRDIAVLRTLGFVRRQVVGSVSVQATTYVVVGVILGAPTGIVIGRFAWSTVAQDIGVRVAVFVPLVALVTVAAGALVVANLAAVMPARLAASVRPAEVLRTE